MRFEIEDMLSLPGNPAKPNDDAFCHTETLAAVFDGATGLGDPLLPVDSDAAWIARRGAEGLVLYAGANAPRAILRQTAAGAEREFADLRLRIPRETYEIPFASMMMVAALRDEAEALWFGDCAALVKRPGQALEVVGDAFAKRRREADGVRRLAAEKHVAAPASARDLSDFLSFLRKERNGVNTAPGRWLFSPDARCADHASACRFAVPSGTCMLLASDGFLALATDYGRYDPDGFLAAALEKGLRALYNELRATEESDPGGVRFPRFKKSDDATAILVRVV